MAYKLSQKPEQVKENNGTPPDTFGLDIITL